MSNPWYANKDSVGYNVAVRVPAAIAVALILALLGGWAYFVTAEPNNGGASQPRTVCDKRGCYYTGE
jgi:hypothetical protein